MSGLDIFRGSRVLITGHTGFKGSWLAVWLHQLGAEVSGIALPPERQRDHFVLLDLQDRIEHHICDIRDNERLSELVGEVQPEFVFHLAAQPLVRRSYREPVLTFETNLIGSVNVWEAVCKVESVRVLINVTSDKCYRNREWQWGYRENDELGGHDPYSASKACAEIAFGAYQESFFQQRPDLAAASVRAGNVIGGGDWAEDRIIPDCIRAFEAGKAVMVRNPKATRPWQHVLEPLGGYLLLASRLRDNGDVFSGAWNFGPGREANRTVHELVETAAAEWGNGRLEVAETGGEEMHEASFLQLNCDKAAGKLGWRSVWGFEESVSHTLAWYRRTHDGDDAWELTTGQIAKYSQAAVHIFGGADD